MANGAIEHLDAAEIARREFALAQLAQRDADIGAIAEARVLSIYGPATSMDGYHFRDSFAKSAQASQQIDWVHQPWLRPIRFAYRHMPKSLRYIVKKLAR